MQRYELENIRERARLAGVSVGALGRAERLRAATAERVAARYLPSGQPGLIAAAPRLRAAPVIAAEDFRWYVAEVHRPLSVADDLVELGLCAYCPLETRITSQPKRAADGKWRRKIRQTPLFGPYLFVGEAFGAPLKFVASLHPFVRKVLGDSVEPLGISPAAIAAINAAELAGKWDFSKPKAGPAFRPGARVTIRGGPFATFLALVERAEGVARTRVAFDLFGRSTAIVVDNAELELA